MPPRKNSKKPTVTEEPSASLGARERLLQAGVEIFSRYGYEGASTRKLAAAAKVNLATILYYFGGKEEYYLAVARHIADTIKQSQDLPMARINEALARPEPDPDELAELLIALIAGKADFLLRPEAQAMGFFILREQVFPTLALDIFYEEFMRPMLEVCCRVVGVILGIDHCRPEAAIRGQALFGEMVTFLTNRAPLMRYLGTREFTEEGVGVVVEIVTQHLRAIVASLRATPGGRKTAGAPRRGRGLA